MRKWILMTALVLLASGSGPLLAQTVYYVSASLGNDSWSGLLAEPNTNSTDGPKQSVSAAQPIAQGLGAGDQLLFRRGDAWSHTGSLFYLSQAHGNPQAYAVIGAYGAGEKPLFDVAGTSPAIFLRGSNDIPTSYLKIEDLHITTTAAPGNRPTGLYAIETYRTNEPHHIIFDGVVVEELKFGADLQADHITVTHSTFRNNYGLEPETGHTQGIFASASNIVIRDSLFIDNGKPGVGFDHNTYLSNCEDCVYTGNTVTGGFSGLKVRKGQNITVSNNTMHGIEFSTITVGADDDKTLVNAVVAGNTLYDTGRGINVKAQSAGTSFIDGLVIKNNLIYNTSVTGIIVQNTHLQNTVLYNNLIYANSGSASLWIRSNAPLDGPLTIQNSVLANPVGLSGALLWVENPSLAGLVLDHNLYHGFSVTLANIGGTLYPSLAALQAAFADAEIHGLEQDPQFANAPGNFYPASADGPTVDNGISLRGVVDQDIDGHPRPVVTKFAASFSWDLGPYEFGSGPPVAPNGLRTK